MFCRYGGDEFLLIIPLKVLSEASDLARELVQSQRGSISDGQKSFSYAASVGVGFYPIENDTFDKALHRADMALYSSKRKGKGTFSMYIRQVDSAGF